MRNALLLSILALLAPCGKVGANPWQPAQPAHAPLETRAALIVDCGQDCIRQSDGKPGSGFHLNNVRFVRTTGGLWQTEPLVKEDSGVDIDGDGFNDDVVRYVPFSMQRRLNPDMPWFDSRAGSPRWFGGIALQQADLLTTSFSENGINDETVHPPFSPRDNWTLFHESYEINRPYRFHAAWIWRKDDFLGGGARGRVFFDKRSRLAVYLERYWMGFEGMRWVVRDGEQFLVSEEIFKGAGQAAMTTDGKAHVFCPHGKRWAKWNPSGPHNIAFPVDGARFEEHEFRDVRAVGWYLFKDRFVPAYTGFKWYAFEATAMVEMPKRPSEHLAMIEVRDSSGRVPPFYLGAHEVAYELWKDVLRLARSNTFVMQRGFNFDRDGDMGSMDVGSFAHSLDEPVTDITLHDAAAWCNALSVREARTACYYEDAEFKTMLREVVVNPAIGEKPRPKIFVRWDADGYRLPTAAEWSGALARGKPRPASTNARGTHAVGSRPADAAGFYDLLGNAWELVWTYGDCFDPRQETPVQARGGDFRWPDTRTASEWTTGLRVVRRETGLPSPPQLDPDSAAPVSAVLPEPQVPDKPALLVALVPVSEKPYAVGKTEITYKQWRTVRDWANAHGYSFCNDGDMGSMDWWGIDGLPPARSHAPDEPATDITGYDAMVWCNALSDLEGLQPVYYLDVTCNRVLRHAFRFRPLMFLDFEKIQGFKSDGWKQDICEKPAANGYRLLSAAEFLHAALAGNTEGKQQPRATWGNNPADVFGAAWMLDSANGTTHPVGTSKPNALGLFDLDGNVSELGAAINDRHGQQTSHGGGFLDLAAGLNLPTLAKRVPRGWGYPDVGLRVMRLKSP